MNTHRAGRAKRNRLAGIIIILCTFAAVVLFFLWHQGMFKDISEEEKLLDKKLSENITVPEKTPSPEKDSADVVAPETQDQAPPENHVSDQDQETSPAENSEQDQLTTPSNQPALKGEEQPVSSGEEQSSQQQSSEPDTATPSDKICSNSAATIKQFYQHLDAQDYMKAYTLSSTSETYFNELIQKLLDNPPIVSGEMNDLFTILQNTAHFFRVIGKNNILIIKGILDREKDQFENVLAQFYSLLRTPKCPQQSLSLTVKETSLYDYAGFFLNTMGGRLYLFRRDSMSRMVVSYYAILLIDQANKDANNRHGIEIGTSINQLISEMESTSNTLLLKDSYLDKLYALKEEYQR